MITSGMELGKHRDPKGHANVNDSIHYFILFHTKKSSLEYLKTLYEIDTFRISKYELVT